MNKNYIVALVALVLSFAAGRYSVDINKRTEIDETKKTRTDTTIVTIKEPSGKETTTTVIKERETTKKELNQVESSQKAILNIAILGAYDPTQNQPSYGLSISKQFIGPVTLGVFGLTNGVAGVSIGVNF